MWFSLTPRVLPHAAETTPASTALGHLPEPGTLPDHLSNKNSDPTTSHGQSRERVRGCDAQRQACMAPTSWPNPTTTPMRGLGSKRLSSSDEERAGEPQLGWLGCLGVIP